MTPDDTKRENDFLDLFLHPGWKALMQDMREAHAVLVETAWTVDGEKELYKRKGEIQKLSELLAFEDLTKMQIDAREEEGRGPFLYE